MPAPLTIVRSPLFSLSRNPIWYRFLSNNYITSNGVAAVYDLYIPNGIAVGSKFDLVIGLKRYTFTCATTPDGFGYQFRSYTLIAQFNNMVLDFDGNYYLNRYFSMVSTFGTGKIRLTAREVGSDFNISIENVTGGVTLTQIAAGNSKTYRDNFKTFMDIYQQNNFFGAKENNLIAQVDADPHKDAVTSTLAADEFVFDFEIQNILNSLLSPYVPAANEVLIKKATGIMTAYWVKYGEIYNVAPIVQYNTLIAGVGNYKQVLLGGWKVDDDIATLCLAITNLEFLNRQPVVKVVSKDSPEFLFKYLASAATNLQLKYTIIYSDGSSESGKILTPIATSLANTIYCFPCSWNALGFGNLNPTKTPVFYELYVTNSVDAILSVKQTFILDLNYYETTTFIAFLGAAGAMETVWCNGIVTTQLKNESDTYQKAQLPWSIKGDTLLSHTNSKQSSIVTISSGFKSFDYIMWLKDLAQSETVLILDNGSWSSCRLDKSSIKDLPSATEDLFAISFDIERLEKI